MDLRSAAIHDNAAYDLLKNEKELIGTQSAKLVAVLLNLSQKYEKSLRSVAIFDTYPTSISKFSQKATNLIFRHLETSGATNAK